MDYGASLKSRRTNLNAKSAHYARQSTFLGSSRQLRGIIVRLAGKEGGATLKKLAEISGRALEEARSEALRLEKEGLVLIEKGRVLLP
jgi:hypothetical protein